MANYIALIRKEAESDFGVDFPDFPGCITAGSTVDEAKDMAVEALTLHIEGMVEDGDDIPAPSDLEAVMSDRDTRDTVAFLVSTPEEDKTVRVNLTFRQSTLAAIDRNAARRGKSRSAYLAEVGA